MTQTVDSVKEVKWVAGFDNSHLLKDRPGLDQLIGKTAQVVMDEDSGKLSWNEFLRVLMDRTGASRDRVVMVTAGGLKFDRTGKCVLRPGVSFK